MLPHSPHGESVFGENSFYRTPGGKWAQETSTECLQQRYAMVEPGKVQGRDRVGILGCPVSTEPAGLYSQKIRFIEKPGVQDWWGRHVSKRSSDHRVDNPEVKIQVRDLVELWVMLISLPHRGSIFGENSFYLAPGCKLAQETCGGCPQQCKRLRRARQSSGTVPCGDCRRGHGVSIRGKFVLSRHPKYKTSGVDMWLNAVLTPGCPTPKSKFSYRTYRCELLVLLAPLLN